MPSGAVHATVTSAATDLESVTVKAAADPSATDAEGPDMLSFAPSTRRLVVRSVRVTLAGLTFSPVAVPDTDIVSSPSSTPSSVGVMVRVPTPLTASAGIVMLASVVAV